MTTSAITKKHWLNCQWGNDECSWTVNGEMMDAAELSMGKRWMQLNCQWGNDGCSWTVNGEMMGAAELSMGKWWVQLNCSQRRHEDDIFVVSIGLCSRFLSSFRHLLQNVSGGFVRKQIPPPSPPPFLTHTLCSSWADLESPYKHWIL